MCGLRFVFPTRRLRTIFMHLSTHKGKVHLVGHGALFSTLAWLVLNKSSKSSLYFCPKFLFFCYYTVVPNMAFIHLCIWVTIDLIKELSTRGMVQMCRLNPMVGPYVGFCIRL